MKFSGAGLRILAACVSLLIFQIIAGMLVPVKIAMPAKYLPWWVLSTILVATSLSVAAIRADWRGWRLGLAIASIPAAMTFVTMIESMVFLSATHIDWPRLAAMQLISCALSAPVWMLLFGMGREAPTNRYHPVGARSWFGRLWRAVVADVSYFVLYYTAGTIIFPFVKDYYATQTLPSLGVLVAVQLLVRGPVFVAMCLLLVRMLGLPRVAGALATGAVFTLLTGVAPLMAPNMVLPDAVRWVHFGEVVSSNFVFGTVVGMLWGRPNAAG